MERRAKKRDYAWENRTRVETRLPLELLRVLQLWADASGRTISQTAADMLAQTLRARAPMTIGAFEARKNIAEKNNAVR